MTSKEIGKADIAVPKNLTIRKPERSATLTSHGTRGLWKSKQLDSITNEFDAVFPGNAETSSQLLEKNPGLLAIRNKTAKSKSRSTKTKPYTIRPITAAEQPQLIPTLFNRPTTTFQHTRHQSSVQYVQKNIEAERAALSFSEDPVAYFAKRKDGSGHKFIYLNYAGDRNNPNFNPYELKKVPYAEIDEEYFTMSASGVTRIQPDGNTEQVSIDTWAKESSIFMSIRKLKTFSQYYYWRPFRFWKKFVMNQRYSQLNQFLNVHPYWSNKRFFSSIISILSTTSDSMIKKYLLPFIPQKKYTLTSFHQIVEENKKLLYKEFSEFLQNIAKIICDLYISIKDPTRIKVEDKDFQEIKRRNPNIGQLIVLEQKIAAEKDRRVKLVQNEISSLSYFIRMIDYMILESMAKSCSECWELAAENASQEQSSIFQIEMSFSDDGKVSFDIPLEEVIGNVRKCLHDSFITLNELPRLTNMVQLREYLKENIVDGPTFESIKAPDTSYSKNEDIILNIISASYKSAEASCQAYKDYYSIFKLGVNWNEERYIHKRGGEEKEYNLSQLIGDNDLPTPLIFNYAKEPTVDFNVIRVDIEKFKADINKMSQFHTCTSKGILFIDGRKLKSFLEPIPTKSLELIHNTLIDLLKRKMEYLLNLFSYCAKKLKKEPASLEQYVEFCEFTAAIEEITPLIAMEITFTDELRTLLEESNLHTVLGIQNPQELVSTRNPLHDAFKTFKSDKLIARNLKELDADKFTIVLQQRLRIREQKLNKYNSTIMSYPLNVANARVDVLLPEMKQIKEKIIQIEPEIDALIHCQKVMGVKQPDLSIYKDMKAGSLFTVDLYQTIVQFNDIQDQMENIPFSTINIEKFSNDVKTLDQDIFNLRNAGRPVNSLLTDLYQKFDQILSFIDQLKQLASGNLRLRHWNKLFDECGQPNQYTPQITISEMAKMGILAQKEKIHVITSNSQGECELETNFSNIKMKWMEVQLPLLDSQVKSEDSLLLGNVNLLFQEITDTQLTLQQMLQVPFVQSIAKDIKELSLVLENYAQVVDAWSTFQANWVILSTFFSQEETKTILEAQSHKFQMVRRRWMALIRHTLENTTLFHVCSFPSLLDMLIENNRTLETILVASVKYIDKKREIMPRLYFLSNDEVLTLLSTTNFDLFNKHLIKLFMHIKNFDYHITEAEQNQQKKKLPSKTTEVKKLNKFLNCQDFSKLKIYGMVSQSFDSIVFDKKLRCAGPVEKWVNDLISIMKNYIKDEIGKSLKTCSSVPLNDWVMGAPTYIAILTLYINFTSDIEECFVNFENNPRAFANYENTISQKIDDLINALSSPLSPHELQKISSIITLFNAQISIVRSLSEKIPLYSQRMNWGNRIKMRFNPDKKILTVEFGETVIEHGYEYWGHGVQYIYTPSTEKVLLNLCSSISNGGKVYDTPYIYGSAMCGKKHLISDLASLYGQFIYFIPTFKEKNFYIYERLLIGAAKTGFWLAFHNIQLNSQPNLCFLYESIRDLTNKKIANERFCNIAGKKVELISNTTLFFTGDNSIFSGKTKSNKANAFPHQLRAFLKPIAMRPPETKFVIELKLISHGFKATKHISQKLFLFLSAISHTFPYLNLSFVYQPAITIVNNAHELIRVLMHTKNPNAVVNYYESLRTAEEYVVARSIYDYFVSRIEWTHLDSFLQVLYGHFQIFDGFDSFKKSILDDTTFPSDQYDHILKDISRSVIDEHFTPKLSEYLINKMLTLYHMMAKYKCIIIYGPINSGKSTIIDLLKDTLQVLINEAEDNKKFSDIMTIKLHEWFYMNDSWEQMFGKMTLENIPITPLQSGRISGRIVNELNQTFETMPIWNSGQIHAFMHNLTTDTQYHNILKLNGPLTPRIVNFLSEMLTSDGTNYIKLNTMDTIECNKNFHIIIETESIENLNPAMIMNCALLPMKNMQVDKTNTILDPEIIFNRAVSGFKGEIEETTVSIFKKLFITMAPEVVHHIYEIDNYVSKIPGGDVIISDHLPFNAMQLALYYFEQASLMNKNDENQLKTILVLALFYSFSGIIKPSALGLFDNWIRTTFIIEIPSDWIGYNVPDSFWDLYQRPSMSSLRFYRGKLIPHDYNLLLEKPIISKRMECPNFKLPMDISICTAQYLPIIGQAKILDRHRQHYLIFGPKISGKSTMMKFIFHHNNDTIPITIPVSQISKGSDLIDFINLHTPIITKNYVMLHDTKTYALIFDNVPCDNFYALEFIKMLVDSSSFPVYSKKDPKFLDRLQVRNFYVIVIMEDISNLPVTFFSHFYIMHLNEPTSNTINYVLKHIGSQFGISPKLLAAVSQFAEQYCRNPDAPFLFTKLIEVLALINGRSALNERDTISCVRTFLFELNYLLYHKIHDEKVIAKIKALYDNNFQETNIKDLFANILDGVDLIYPDINLSQDLSCCAVSLPIKPMVSVRDMLYEKYDEYNKTRGCNNIQMVFYKPTINDIILLQRALSYPGTSIVLKGDNGSGRFTLSRFVTFLVGYEFFEIPIYSELDGLSHDMRKDRIRKVIQKPLVECILKQKQVVVFYRVESSSKIAKIDEDVLSSLFYLNDFTPYFSSSELEDLYYKTANSLKIKHEDKTTIYQQITASLKIRLHIIISADRLFNSMNYPSFVEIRFQQTDENYTTCARDMLLNPEFANIIDKFPENLPSIFIKIHKIIKSHTKTVISRHFYDFLNSFYFYATKCKKELFMKHSSIQVAIEFLSQLNTEMKNTEMNMKEIIPALQALEGNDDNYKRVISARRKDLRVKQLKLEENERMKTIELRKINEEVISLRTELIDLNVRVDLARQRLDSITSQQFDLVKQLGNDPKPAFKLLIEMILAFLDQPTQFDPHGKRLLYDQNFEDEIKTKIDHKNVDPISLVKAKPLFTQAQVSKNDFDDLSLQCSILHDWISSIYYFAASSEKLSEKQKEYEEKSEEFHEFEEKLKNEKEQMSITFSSLDEEMKQFQDAVTHKENLTNKYNIFESRKRLLDSLFKGFDQLHEKWKNEYENFEDNNKAIIGNTIILSVYLTYFGALSKEQRIEIFYDIFDEMKRYSLLANYDAPIEYVESQLYIISDMQNESTTNNSFYDAVAELQTDLRMIKSVKKAPLIIDPDGVVNDKLKVMFKNVVFASYLVDNLFKVLKTAAKLGQTLVLEDVNFLDCQIIPFLEVFVTYKPVTEITYESHVIKVHPDFKLILFTSLSNAHEIPENLRVLSNVINTTESSMKEVQHRITCCFLNHFDSEMLPRLQSIKRAELQHHLEILRFEKMTLDSIEGIAKLIEQDDKYDCLSDEENIGKLLQAKECYYAATNVTNDHRSIQNELRMTTESFIKSINLCTSFWVALNHYLPQVRSCHVFSLDQFLSLCNTAIISSGFHQGIISQEQLNKMNSTLIHQIMKWSLPMMSFKDAIFFLFISGFTSLLLQDKVKKEDLDSIIGHIEEEYDGYLDHVNIDIHSGESLDQLKFSNISNIFSFIEKFVIECFGNDYSKFFPIFTLESFISQTAKVPVLIQLHNSKDAANLLEYYIGLRSKSASYVSISLCDDQSVLSDARKKIYGSMKSDLCVALHYPSNSSLVASFINDIINNLSSRKIIADHHKNLNSGPSSPSKVSKSISSNPSENNIPSTIGSNKANYVSGKAEINGVPNLIDSNTVVHEDFRMVIICSTTDGLSRNTLRKCSRLEYESYPSIKHQLLEIYNHHASAIQVATTSQNRKLNYVLSLLFSLINFRKFIKPIGFTYDVPIDELRLRNFIIKLKDRLDCILTNNTNYIPMKNIRDDIFDVELGSGIFDSFDSRKLKNHIFSAISPELLDDGFYFIEQNSEEMDKWSIPNDVLPSNFSHLVETRVPVFPTTDVLSMNKIISYPLRNWSLSRWISKTFLKIHKETESFDIVEAKSKLTEIFNKKLPQEILVTRIDEMKTPTQLFLLGEIKAFNELIREMRGVIGNTITSTTKDAFIEMYRRNIFPEQWRNKAAFSYTKSFSKFVDFLIEKYDLLSTWMKNGIVPSVIDVKLIKSIKGLLFSYLNDIAIQRQMTIDVLSYDFIFGEKNVTSTSENGAGLCLSGIYVVGGNWDFNEKKLIQPNSKTPPVSPMPNCLCVPVKITTKSQHTFSCPLFRTMPSKTFMLNVDKVVVDGVSNNFQWNVPLKSDVFEKQLISTGVSLICQKPEFSSK